MANVGKHTYRTRILWVSSTTSRLLTGIIFHGTDHFGWGGSSKQAPAPLSTRGPFPSRQPQCHCPSRWKRPSCWLSWGLWWRLCWLWWRLWSLPTLVLEASQAVSLRTWTQVLKETACDLVRVILATANMLKNHLPLIAGATAFPLSLPSWGCKTWEPRKCRFTAVASTHSTDSGWDRHIDGENKIGRGDQTSSKCLVKISGISLNKRMPCLGGMIMTPLWTIFNHEMMKWLQKIGVSLPLLQTRQVADQAYRIEVNGRAGRRTDSMTTPHERSRWGLFFMV